MTIRQRGGVGRSAPVVLLLALCAFVFCVSSPASAAGIVAKDGKIHACYKAKGKGKGTLRVVRSAKVKCPKKWKKTAWLAAGQSGPQGEQGPRGETGSTGATGATGAPGRNENVVVNELEDKVTELLSKVQSLETILKGINNAQLKEAIAAIAKVETLEAAVGSLCSQASALTSQSNALESAFGGLSLNGVLTTLGGALNVPTLPGPLSSFSCPS
jgi:hypothetical protein